MAANDYYKTQYSFPNRIEAPLPPLPHSASENPAHPQSKISPFSSPFDDPNYRPYAGESEPTLASNNSYQTGGRIDQESGHYTDNIPLKNSGKGNSDQFGSENLRYDSGNSNAIVSHNLGPRSRRRSKPGFLNRKTPWIVYGFTLIQSIVFIAELVKNGVLTKTPIEIHPQFNPMIGPSPYVLINMGARYVPCMRATPQIQENPDITWPCPNSTSSDTASPMNTCSLSQICGFSDHHTGSQHPSQWFRFIIPMFLHAGIIHIAFNMLLQLTMGREMEKTIGSLRFALVYLSSGIFGFVLGGNFAPIGIASTGASGSLFGVIALFLLDLLYHWKERRSPWTDLFWIVIDIVVSFVLGLLPGLDNFSHIGGFLMGLVLGVCLLHSPAVLRQRVGADNLPYIPVNGVQKGQQRENVAFKGLVKQPMGFFKGRKLLWWAWWLVRAAALIGVLICFIVLLKNFYKKHPSTCGWCKYLSCLHVNHWCDIGNLQLESKNVTTKRHLFDNTSPMGLDSFI